MRFNYGQGACGCCICYDWGDNNEAILIKTSIDGWWEKISIQWKKYFHELKKELDLRIPDDYLKEFYKKLKSTSERKEYINRGSHLSYMFLLVKVKHAFMKTDYIWACHELQDILHYEDIFQNRIKCNVLSLLEEYIETG